MAVGLAILPALFALTVLCGWLSGNNVVERLGLASVTMNPTTALGLLLLSAGALYRVKHQPERQPSGHRRWVAHLLLVAAIGIGLAKILDAATGNHMGPDAWLLASQLGTNPGLPSRMAPNAALCFVLIGLALLVMQRPTQRAAIAAQLLALATTSIALFAIVGYLYGVRRFYGVAAFFPMALHTAIAFLCFAAYIFTKTATRGLASPLVDSGPAGRTSRVLLPAAILLPLFFGWLRQQGEQSGLWTAEIGLALMVIANMLSLTGLIWWNAEQLLVADTRRRRAEIDLARMAHHDFLTGLPNRARFMAKLMERMEHHRRRSDDDSFAVIYMDLDNFKAVNDQLGHMAGDTLLREVSLHLQRCARTRYDIVARLGGDEFAMLLEHIRSAEDAAAVARRIVNGMAQKFGPIGRQVSIGMSVGIVVADLRHDAPENLLNDADQALYAAKRRGKGCFTVFGESQMALDNA